MKYKQTLGAGIMALVTVATVHAGGAGWLQNFDKAKQQAAVEKKDLLMDFTGSDWCGWCVKLNKEIFAKKEFAEGVKDSFVLVELDYPMSEKNKQQQPVEIKEQNAQLAKVYAIEGYPTVLLADSAGRPYAKIYQQNEDAGSYARNVNTLQANRVKRDASFAKAEAAKGLEKAKLLVEGLSAVDPEFLERFYKNEITTIQENDKDDTLGFAKQIKARAKESSAQAAPAISPDEADEMAAIEKALKPLEEKLPPLFEAQKHDEALKVIDDYLRGTPDLNLHAKQALIMTKAQLSLQKTDVATALKLLNEGIEISSGSFTAREMKALRASLKEDEAGKGPLAPRLKAVLAAKQKSEVTKQEMEAKRTVEPILEKVTLLMKSGKADEGIKEIDAYLKGQAELDPFSRQMLLLTKAGLLADKGDTQAASALLDEAVKLAPDSTVAQEGAQELRAAIRKAAGKDASGSKKKENGK
ncbi:MAG: thioredoxin family protein [Kiritimatiellaeota bacterium]|nr:thioredoxin family protein [Kiritimatiellota bacterium]